MHHVPASCLLPLRPLHGNRRAQILLGPIRDLLTRRSWLCANDALVELEAGGCGGAADGGDLCLRCVADPQEAISSSVLPLLVHYCPGAAAAFAQSRNGVLLDYAGHRSCDSSGI